MLVNIKRRDFTSEFPNPVRALNAGSRGYGGRIFKAAMVIS